MDNTSTFPTVDAEKVINLFNEYKSLNDKRYKPYGIGEPDYDTINKQSLILQKLDELVRCRINWLVDFMGHLPIFIDLNNDKLLVTKDVITSSKYCIDMIEKDEIFHHYNTYGILSLYTCSQKNIVAIFVSGEDCNHYPIYSNMFIPISMIIENNELKLKHVILSEAVKRGASKISELSVKYDIEKECQSKLVNMLNEVNNGYRKHISDSGCQ